MTAPPIERHTQGERHRPETERRAPVNKWAITLAVAAALGFLYVVRLAVLPFLIAAAIAYVAGPAVRWFERRLRLSHANAAVAVYLLIMGGLGGFGYWSAGVFGGDLANVAREAPVVIHKFLVELFGSERFVVLGRSFEATAVTQQVLDGLIGAIGEPREWLTASVLGFAALTAFILIIVLLFYFLSAGAELARGVLWLVPPEYREEVAEIAAKIDPMLRRYLFGLIVIVIFASFISWIAIEFFLHLAFAPLLALLTGLLELIPVIGPIASAAIIGLLALEQHGLWAVIAFAVYVTVFRLLIDRLIGPVVLGRAASVHPIVVIFAFLAGGMFLGVSGVILAVPIAASVKIVLGHYYAQPTRRSSH